MQAVRISTPQVVFLAIFALSGFAGLIYESIWSHYLKLFLGHAAYAQALVLMIFMGGMAAGSALAARYSIKIKHALIGYAVVEGLIGLSALIFHGLFNGATNWAFDSVLPGMTSPMSIELFKWTLAALLILPQSLLLGSTFPLMSAGLVRRQPDKAGYNLAMLYFSNSLGAAVGVLASGFVLIPAFGLPGALMIAGIINVALALFVWLLARSDHGESRDELSKVYAHIGGHPASKRLVLILLTVAFVSSAASFFYEIGWIRMLSLVLGSATHSFELMLSSFILGLAIGGFLIRGKIDHLQHPLRTLVMIQVSMGLLAVLTIPVYTATFEMMGWGMAVLQRTADGYDIYSIFKHLIALLVMLPATILAGMTLPIITHTLLKAGQGEQAIGKVYAINTVGAIAGVVLASLVVMPALGLRAVILTGAMADIALGALMLWMLRNEAGMAVSTLGKTSSLQRSYLLLGGVTLGWLGVLMLAPFNLGQMSSGVFRTGALGLEAADERLVIDHFDGATATITTYYSDAKKEMVSILTNGKPDAAVSSNSVASQDELTMTSAAFLPLAVHQEAKDIAIIGLGSGYTGHTFLGDADVVRVDTIEIEPKIVEAAHHAFGGLLPRVFEDPRSHIIINDAKTYFSANKSQYDVIVAEPSNPWVSGVASLFTQEFYTRVKRYLKPEGVYVQWLQGYEISLPLASTVFAALVREFDDVQLYALGNSDFLLLAKPKGALPSIGVRPFKADGLTELLQRVGLTSVPELELRRVAGKKTLQLLSEALESRPNSDYYPILDLGAEKTRFMQNEISELIRFRPQGFMLTEYLDGFKPLSNLKISKNDATIIGLEARSGLGYSKALIRWANGEVPLQFNPDDGLNKGQFRPIGYLLSETSCAKGLEDEWLTDISRILIASLPYADVHALNAPITQIMQLPCANKSPETLLWFSFFRSINDRDYPSVLSKGQELLASKNVIQGDKRWLAFNTALAALVLKDYEAMAVIWKPYVNKHRADEVERRVLDLALTREILAHKAKVKAQADREFFKH
jgi:predicted membrane-bound spermidine synthase